FSAYCCSPSASSSFPSSTAIGDQLRACSSGRSDSRWSSTDLPAAGMDGTRGSMSATFASSTVRATRHCLHCRRFTLRSHGRHCCSSICVSRRRCSTGRNRFGLTGAPPAEIAAPLDVRGDVTGNSLAEWRGSSGRLYARLDYVDVAAWRAWLPLPADIKSGKGAVRVWFQYADGEPREALADLVLTDVAARLTPQLQE